MTSAFCKRYQPTTVSRWDYNGEVKIQQYRKAAQPVEGSISKQSLGLDSKGCARSSSIISFVISPAVTPLHGPKRAVPNIASLHGKILQRAYERCGLLPIACLSIASAGWCRNENVDMVPAHYTTQNFDFVPFTKESDQRSGSAKSASTNSRASKSRRSSICSPIPIKRTGIPISRQTLATIPPLAVPSSLVSANPLTPTAS